MSNLVDEIKALVKEAEEEVKEFFGKEAPAPVAQPQAAASTAEVITAELIPAAPVGHTDDVPTYEPATPAA